MRIVIIWHMHQPMYGVTTNGNSRRYHMPWAFVHGIREYFDMAEMARRCQARVTFNLVPSLLLQLEEYASNRANDIWLRHYLKPAEELSEQERTFIKRNFFSVNPENFIKPYPEFAALWQRRTSVFSVQDYRDLQMWWLLSQISAFHHREDARIKKLVAKGQGFTEQDKIELYGIAVEIIRRTLEIYLELARNNVVEVSTSPFFHPILPLLIDSSVARVSMPDAPMPETVFLHPEDADLHMREALDFMGKRGYRISGMWPSEGSVSEETIKLLSRNSIRWTATDEGILKFSGRDDPHRPYGFSGVKLFFRDHGLSDAIGFVYQKWPPEKAVLDFIHHLEGIRKAKSDSAVVTIILDGENPWPGYPEGGLDFLRLLYSQLSERFELVTPSDILSEDVEELERLHPGSWIRSDFSMWIGHPTKNRAWELLTKVREDFGDLSSVDAPDSGEFMAAEGSDWFWWYGDSSNIYGRLFDLLFREHLKAAFSLRGRQPPEYLDNPIVDESAPRVFRPYGQIRPRIDGKISGYFEWLYAGSIDFTRDEIGTMMIGEPLLSGVKFGFDENGNLYLMVEGADRMDRVLKGKQLRITIDDGTVLEISADSARAIKARREAELKFSAQKVLEVMVPHELLSDGQEHRLKFELIENGRLIEEHPVSGWFNITSEVDNWAV